jgi:hypothetical protein
VSSTQLRNVAAAVAVIAALGTVSACGGGKSSTGAHQSGAPSGGQQSAVGSVIGALLKVKSSTDQAKSAKVDITADQGQLGKTHQTGALDWSDGLQGDLTVTPDGDSLAKAMGVSEIRYTKDALYEQMNSGSGGSHWMKITYAALDKQGPAGKATRMQLQSGNPNQTVEMLIASGDVKVVGKEDVRGVQATHYSGLLDAAKVAADTTPGLSQAEQQQLKQQMHDDGVTADQIDVWVNSDNLVVEKAEQIKTARGTSTTTTYYSEYGTKVTVTPPPAADTFDPGSLRTAAPSQS